MQHEEDASLNKLLCLSFYSNLQLSTSLLCFAWSGSDKDYSPRWEKNKDIINKNHNLIWINWLLKYPGVGRRGGDVKNVKFRKQSLVRGFQTSKWYLNKDILWYHCHAMNTSLSACWHVNHCWEGSNVSNSFYNVNQLLLYIRTSETPNSSEKHCWAGLLLCHQTANSYQFIDAGKNNHMDFFPLNLPLFGN